MRLDESPFYLLEAPESEMQLCTDSRNGVIVREQISCPLDPGHARVGRFFSDLNVIAPGPPTSDILFTWVTPCLVQETVISIMEKEQLTGVWTKPAKAVTRKTGEAIAVRRLGVTGWAGIVPPESGVTLHEYCPGCQFTHWSELTNANALINPDNWDGSDFFMIWPMPAYFFVSEKVRKVFADYNLKGARFSKTFPEGSGMGFSPQRLSYWMPEERAHQIGDPLGIY